MLSNLREIRKQFIDSLQRYDAISGASDADYLLCQIIGINLSKLIVTEFYPLTERQLKKIDNYHKQYLAGTPIAYILGYSDFFNYRFTVNKSVLIPRSDSELMVETLVHFITQKYKQEQSINLLELGIGSGALLISIALSLREKKYNNLSLWAVDKNKRALSIALKNAQSYNLNIKFIQSNWYEELSPKKQFDIIFSNPPYIAKNDSHLKQLTFEPISALVSANNGLVDLTKIIKQSPQYLKTNGTIALEHGFNQGEAVKILLQKNNFKKIVQKLDNGQRLRISLATHTP